MDKTVESKDHMYLRHFKGSLSIQTDIGLVVIEREMMRPKGKRKMVEQLVIRIVPNSLEPFDIVQKERQVKIFTNGNGGKN